MWCLDVHAGVPMKAKSAPGAKRYHDHAHALVDDPAGCPLVIDPRIDPGQVGLARLDDGALRDRGLEPLAILGVRDESDTDVGIEHHEAPATLTGDQLRQRGRHGLEHEPKRSHIEGLHVRPELFGEHLEREVGRGCSLDEELVFGEAFAVDVRDGDGCGLGAGARERQAGSV